MTEIVDELKEQRRTDTRRAWWFAGGVVMLVLGVVALVWFRDVEPPDDAAMLPVFTEGGGKDNALLQFVKEVEALPDSGYEDLSQEARSKAWSASKEVGELLAQPQNVKRIEAWERLMATDMNEWRWQLQDEPSLKAAHAGRKLKQTQIMANLMCIRAVLLAREEKEAEAIRVALDICRMGEGLMKAEGGLIHWLVANTISTSGWRTVHDVLALGGTDEAMLAELQEEISSIRTNALPALAGAFRAEYLWMKTNLATLSEDPSSLHPRLNHFVMALTFKENMTLRTYMHYQRPMVEAAERGTMQFAKTSAEFQKRLDAWGWRGWWKHVHPNGMGQWLAMLGLATQTRIGERGVVAAVPRDFTILMLAVRRFELKHGRPPTSEEDLAPQFIHKIPLDPIDGKPLRWNEAGHRVYGVGNDRVDQGGDLTSPVYSGEKQMNLRANDFGVFYLWGEEARSFQEEEYGNKNGVSKTKEPPKRRRLLKGPQNSE